MGNKERSTSASISASVNSVNGLNLIAAADVVDQHVDPAQFALLPARRLLRHLPRFPGPR